MVYFIYDIPSLKLTARTCKKGHGLNHLDEFVFIDFSRNPRHLVRGQRLFSKDKEHKTPHTHPNQPTETNQHYTCPPPKKKKRRTKKTSNLTIRSHPHFFWKIPLTLHQQGMWAKSLTKGQNTRLQICPLYIFGNNSRQMVPKDLNTGETRVWWLDSGPSLYIPDFGSNNE